MTPLPNGLSFIPKRTITTKDNEEKDHWKYKLNQLLKAVQRGDVGSFKDVEDFFTQHHEAEVRDMYKQAQKDFFSMDLIAAFLDFVPDEHKDIALQSYIDAVARQGREIYTPTKTDKTTEV